ncbi:MAG: glucose-6-phosphate dehydrogenase assembly protein OpcA [Acidimicrobiales bacterium]
MSPTTTLGRWEGTGVRMRDVLGALDGLRRAERHWATRTSVLTLVLVTQDPGAGRQARDAVHELGSRHPARSVLLVADPAGDAGHGLDAEVCLAGGQAGSRAVWFEDVTLTVRGPLANHLDSLIEPLTLPDLTVVAWYVDGLPAPGDPLVGAADVVMVDARRFGGTACFPVLDALARRRPVVDLSWARLRPWRELLAGLFDGRDARPFIAGVEAAEVEGRSGPRHLLGGWLADRLGLAPLGLRMATAEHVSVRLRCHHAGRVGHFAVERRGDTRAVRARASIEGGVELEQAIVLPELTPAWGLADAFSHLQRDPVYEGALRAAVAVAAAGRVPAGEG